MEASLLALAKSIYYKVNCIRMNFFGLTDVVGREHLSIKSAIFTVIPALFSIQHALTP